MQEPVRITESTNLPVSVDLLRDHLRLGTTDEDTLLEVYLAAAVAFVETKTGRAISEATWTQVLDSFPAGGITIPVGPLQDGSLTITYLDADAVEQVMADADLIVDLQAIEARVQPVSGTWPTTADRIAAVTLSWVAASEICPPALRPAVLMLASHWYANREAVVVGTITAEVPMAVSALIASERRYK